MFYCLCTGLSLAINGCFSHSAYTSWLLQSLLSSHSSRSKCHRVYDRISRISCQARFLPMQLRGPYEKGCRIVLSSSAKRGSASSPVSQRSGMNCSGSAKWRDEW